MLKVTPSNGNDFLITLPTTTNQAQGKTLNSDIIILTVYKDIFNR